MPGGPSNHRFPTPDRWMVIGKRKLPKPQPRPSAPFQSALGDLAIVCPTCRATSDGEMTGPFRDGRVPLDLEVNLWPCEHCDGVFVENAAFEAMVTEISNAAYALPSPWGTPGGRSCPACERPMLVELIGTTTVDRCVAHGIWFDQGELAEALEHCAPPPEEGVIGWLKRLFLGPRDL
jgi:hypothetical protein